MAIRQCALDCAAFAQLKHIYENREEIPAKMRAEGVKVIGKMGCDVPDELIIAVISTWCNMRIGNPPNYDNLLAAYNSLKGQLRLSKTYTTSEVTTE